MLRIDDKALFESAVISEYLDEITPPSLHPEDPFEKAQNRAWIEFGSTMLMSSYRLKTAQDQETFKTERALLTKQLKQLEAQINGTAFFNGEQFRLVDTAYAPVFRWIELLDRNFSTGLLDQAPDLKKWSDNLLSRPSIKNSVVADFEQRVLQRLKDGNSILIQE